MKTNLLVLAVCTATLLLLTGCCPHAKHYQWQVHDMNRPLPTVITPAENPAEPPSDAIVLFDGKDLTKWVTTKNGSPAKWKVENGYMEVVKDTGDIQTKQSFGNCQLHIEWTTPLEVVSDNQDRGNSGVYLMANYEVQVVDSYKNITYADGQAGAMYGQNPPLVNACRPPGQWQSYDIIFHQPVFKHGRVCRPATITVLQNGVLIQDNFKLEGETVHGMRAKYHPHADKLPLLLQDHGHAVRYRNIWLREL
jgi:hypothetical protein